MYDLNRALTDTTRQQLVRDSEFDGYARRAEYSLFVIALAMKMHASRRVAAVHWWAYLK
jgi:hypothetical protein